MDIHIACGAIIEKGGKILLVQEEKENVRGLWNNPAGLIDAGESIFDAAVREAKEETGFKVKLEGLIGIYQYFGGDGTLVIRFQFAASIISGKLKIPKGELLGAKWFTPSEILAMDDSELRGPTVKATVLDYLAGKLYPVDVIKYLK